MKKFMQITAIAALLLVGTLSEAETLRATELDSAMWAKIFAGEMQEMVVEFLKGDELPITVSAEGDFFETLQAQPTPLIIKKNFWLKVNKNTALFSLDGNNFKPLPQVANGTLVVGMGQTEVGGRAHQLNINLKAYQK
ncbi:MAG: hypothetical protein ACXVB4_17565 [Pseudobdellovibrionaceae bacterium]